MADPNVPSPAASGLSDNVASGLAYVTFIPAIIFLAVAPYNTNPKIKFHAWQSICLAVAWFVVWVALMILGAVLSHIPILGALVSALLGLVVGLGFFILWLIAMIQAFQGKQFSIPVIGGFAAKQAGV